MPIRPELRHLYRTPEWAAARKRILARAGGRCEQCRKPAGKVVFTYTWQTWRCSQFPFGREKVYHMAWVALGQHVWRNETGWTIRPAVGSDPGKGSWPARGLPRRIRVQLGVAHVDPEGAFLDDSNLRAWCTWCHLHHDQPQHKISRCDRKDRSRPLLHHQKAQL
jgi:hypothetical protein